MMWKDGLLIKLKLMGIRGRLFNWIKDFMIGRTIQVRVGNETSNQCVVENGTPQGRVISPFIFSIIINVFCIIFSQIQPDIGR